MRRALLLSLAIAFAIACGDSVTEPVPDRSPATPKVLLATSSTDDGLTISTDKDDYAPGETVHFTGAGWPADDVLDILLVDDLQDTVIWTVNTTADGTFEDATYVVNEADIGVTFTLTAKSRATDASLTVQFTDGTISNASIEMRNSPACSAAQSSGTVNSPICAHSSFTISGNGATSAQFRWKSPGTPGSIVHISQREAFPNGTSGAQAYAASFTPTSAGSWIVLLCESANITDLAPSGAPQCAGSSFRATQTFTVNPATTTTDLVSSSNPSTENQSVTFTATVNDQNANPIGNKGTVTFYEFTGTQTCDALGGAASLSGPTALSANPSGGQASFTTATLPAATHVITACYSGTADFVKSFGTVSQVVVPLAIPTTLTVAAATGTYGGQATLSATLTRTSTGAGIDGKTIVFRLNGSDVGNATTNPSGMATKTVHLSSTGTTAGTFIDANTYPAGATTGVGASFAGDAPLNPTSGTASLTINQRAIKVKADANTKVYGNADPTLTYQITDGSLVGSDAFSGTLSRDPGETVAGTPYAITQGTLALSTNYSLTFEGANFSITQRPITVTADAISKFYGDADPALTYQITSGSLAFSDAFNGELTRDAGGTVSGSPYAITQGTLALNANYTLTFVGANFTINPRPVTVTADPKSKFFGDLDPAFTYQLTAGSLVGTDAFTGALTRAVGETVTGSPYAITQGTLALNDNYALTFVGANFTINPRPVTVTADAKSKFFGDPDPVLTYQLTAGTLVGTDAFTGALTREAGETVAGSPYAILQGSLTLGPNYDITFVSADLTIKFWTLTGFYAPVDMPRGEMMLNSIKGGQTVPLKFEVFVGSTERTDVAVVKSFVQNQVTCPMESAIDQIEVTSTGGTVLRYDATAGQFIQNWQTPKTVGKCYRVTMTTLDDSNVYAYFKTK
jgi:hypothetical protein